MAVFGSCAVYQARPFGQEAFILSRDKPSSAHAASVLPPEHGVARWLSLLLPPRCLHCQAPGLPGLDLCADCWQELPWNDVACPLCALPLPHPAPACGVCIKRPPPVTRTLAPLRYEGCVAHLLPRLKFHHQLAVARVLASSITHAVRDSAIAADMDLLLPMPLHPNASLARLQPGRRVARPLAVPALAAASGPAATGSRYRATNRPDARARRRNLRGAFVASSAVKARVLLLDDVITTGTSLRRPAAPCCVPVLRRFVRWP